MQVRGFWKISSVLLTDKVSVKKITKNVSVLHRNLSSNIGALRNLIHILI